MKVDPSTSTYNQQRYRTSRKSNQKWAFILGLITIVVVIVIIVVLAVVLTHETDQPMPKIQREYQDKANIIIKFCTVGEGKGKAYEWMANISDGFGHRKIGSEALERAIDQNVEQFEKEYGLENVHTENASLPLWVRKEEWAFITQPRRKQMAILGLGSTVSTNGNLTKPVVVVTSWDELAARCNLGGDAGIAGKIVVFNQPWEGSYGKSVDYRGNGATKASRCGALAALIRSASSFSINSPHTGQQYYGNDMTKIPAVSITPEDAELMYRMQLRGEKIEVTLFIASYNDDSHKIISRNTIFELPGSLYPNQIVMISGHFDSWDVGSGAMDNGGGASIALRAIVNLKMLIDQGQIPPPKRTIRGIHWTAEEPGHMGSQQYYDSHKNDTNETYVFLQEADEGFFRPLEMPFSGSANAKAMFEQQIYPLVRSLNVSLVTGQLGDADPWAEDGIPGVMLGSSDEGEQRYFAFHHSEGDTPIVYQKNDLDVPTAIWAVVAYVIADMNETVPVGPRVQK